MPIDLNFRPLADALCESESARRFILFVVNGIRMSGRCRITVNDQVSWWKWQKIIVILSVDLYLEWVVGVGYHKWPGQLEEMTENYGHLSVNLYLLHN